MKLRSSRRIITGAAALSLAFATPLALPGAVVPAAMAQELAATIPADAEANLTIHKFSGAPTDANNDGTVADPAPAPNGNKPLKGATFKVQKLQDLSIHKNADWKKVNDAEKGNATAFAGQYNPAEGTDLETDSDGVAKFADLPAGFYLVTETQAPEGYTAADPFIVALPLTNPNGEGWNYDVHVYPKNKKEFKTDKTVIDADKNSGQEIEYHVDANIPEVKKGESIKVMKMTDLLDPRLSATADKVTFQVIAGDDVLVEDASSYFDTQVNPVNGRDYVYAEANETGKAELAKQKQENVDAQIRMIIKPTVKDDLNEDTGEITNQAYVWVNDPSQSGSTEPTSDTPTDPDPDDPGKTPEQKTYLGKVQITKKNKDGDAASQEGAKFQVYKCNSKEDVQNFGGSNGIAGTTTGPALTVAGQDTFTANGDGVVNINGLHVQDYVDGEAIDATDAAPFTGPNAEGYCLVETKAPEGYEMLPEPIFFQLAKGTEATPLSFEVQDPDKNAGFELPLTGARGVILFALLGGGLLLLAGFVSRRNKKAAQ